MSCIRCQKNAALTAQVEAFSEVLKTQAHTLGNHGLSEDEFYRGLFRGAIERIRGQFSATMREKRDFVRAILNFDCEGHGGSEAVVIAYDRRLDAVAFADTLPEFERVKALKWVTLAWVACKTCKGTGEISL